ncbi:LytS/YhcK type 5TM receptor domain-containing protein, partial [Bosea sp. LjRoot9]|uniref:LytS/YhcK type 5TM receptor domain-containing protein n=1 Tax=Bosea sp. LjRoot9 TaxID=3342341 RepID=UPI003F4FF535
MSLIVKLIESLSFVLLAALALTIILPRLDRHQILRQIVVSALLAAAGFFSMNHPFMLQPGLAIDSRNVVVLLAGPVGGILATALVAAPLALYRYSNGGPGMVMGIVGILLSALAGVAIHWRARSRQRDFAMEDVWLVALSSALVLLPPLLLLPNWAMIETVIIRALPFTLMVNVGGATLMALIIVIDAERRETAYRFKTLVQRAPGTLYQRIVRPDKTLSYRFASFSLERSLGITQQEVERDPEVWIGRMLPEDRARFEDARMRQFDDRDNWRFEARYTTVTGAIIWLRSEATMRELPDGTMIWDGILLDVTDEKSLETRRA